MTSGHVRLVYFAWVRERVGHAHEELPLETPVALGALMERVAALSAGHSAALADRGRLRAAVNQEFAGWDALVRPGDEVALFPPVTGG